MLWLLSLWISEHQQTGGTSAFPCHGARGSHSSHRAQSSRGGLQVRGWQVLSHWITLFHDCNVCDPSCESAFLTGPRTHQGYFRIKKPPRKMWKKNNEEQVWAARKQKQVLEKIQKTTRSQKSGGWQIPMPLEMCWHLISDWIQGSGRYFCTFKTQGLDSSQAGTWSSEMAWTN